MDKNPNETTQNSGIIQIDPKHLKSLYNAIGLLQVSSDQPLEETLSELMRILADAVGASAVAVWRPTEDGKHLYIALSQGFNKSFIRYFNEEFPISLSEETIAGRAAATKQPVFVYDLRTDPTIQKLTRASEVTQRILDEDVVSFASLPLLVEEELYGVLNFYFPQPHVYEPGEQHILEDASAMIGIATGNIQYRKQVRRAQETLQEERDQLANLHKAIQALSIRSERPLDEIVDNLASTVGSAIGANAIAVWRPTADKKHLTITNAFGLSEEYVNYYAQKPIDIVKAKDAMIGKAYLERKPAVARNFWEERAAETLPKDVLAYVRKEDFISVASFPLFIEDDVDGVLNFYFPQEHTYPASERYILEVAANTIAIAIGNIQYREEIKDAQEELRKTLAETEKARQRAEAEHAKTESIILNFSDALIALNENQQIELVNPQAETFFALSEQQVVGKAPEDIQANTAFRTLVDFLAGREGGLSRAELSFGKEERIVEVTTAPFDLGTNRTGTMIVIHDITREKRVERVKSEFVTLTAHQLRTPLSGMKWSLGGLLSEEFGPVTPDQKQIIQKALKANGHLIGFVNDLLNIAKIEEGKFIQTTTSVSLGDIIMKAVEQIDDKAKRNNLTLNLELPETPIPPIRADENLIRDVVQNFVDNAIRYTPEGGTITVSAEKTEGTATIYVSDTGIGIPENQKEHIFERFFRAPNAKKMDASGAGTGLFLAKNIIKAHKGTIGFESEEGKGSTFYFTLPLASEKEGASAPEAEDSEQAQENRP